MPPTLQAAGTGGTSVPRATSLNALQRLFRSWDAVHPYNAAHAFQLRGTPLLDAAQQTWNDALAALVLGHVVLRRNRLTHSPATPPPAVHLVPEDISLEDYFSSELDGPFPLGQGAPFRPFLLREGEGTWLGTTYPHWIADSVSIRMLMSDWLMRMCVENPPPSQAVTQVSAGYWKLFGAGGAWRPALAFIKGHQRLRAARKPLTVASGDHPSRVLVRRAPEGLGAAVRACCRERRVRVSDLMLAALLEAASRHIPLQQRPNRRDVAVGCIVDLRPHAHPKIDDAFGLFLGFASIVCRPEEYSDWPRLLESVSRQSEMHRRPGIAATCTAWISAALAVSAFIPGRRTSHFYRKTMPLAAGLSSVNLNRERPMEFFPSPLMDYLRISPTGPIAPAVLSATEMGPRLTLALTYQRGVVNAAAAEAILGSVIDRLEAWCGAAGRSSVDKQPLT
jgi:hypothetical protein